MLRYLCAGFASNDRGCHRNGITGGKAVPEDCLQTSGFRIRGGNSASVPLLRGMDRAHEVGDRLRQMIVSAGVAVCCKAEGNFSSASPPHSAMAGRSSLRILAVSISMAFFVKCIQL